MIVDFTEWFEAVSVALFHNERILGAANPQTLVYDTAFHVLMYFEQVGEKAQVRIVEDKIDGSGRRTTIEIDLRRKPVDAAKDIAVVFFSFENTLNQN